MTRLLLSYLVRIFFRYGYTVFICMMAEIFAYVKLGIVMYNKV